MSEHTRATTGKPRHAIVIGGSIAGLLAARVLSERFEQVTILERDHLPAGDEERAGVPQARHAHALMLGGRMNIERLFPGIVDELTAAGAPTLDQGLDTIALFKTGWAPRVPTELKVLNLSRALLETRVRRRVAAIPNVALRDRAEVTGLLLAGGAPAIAGVRLRARGQQGAPEEALTADLVIEAGGRSTRLPDWLAALGYDRPEEQIIKARMAYASRWYRIPEGHSASWKGIWYQACPPHGTRGALLLPNEGDRWVVTLIGNGGDYPPTDEQGFMEFIRSLPSPELYDAIKNAEPLGPAAGFRNTENRMLAYHKLAARPDRLIVMGDAFCAFNPTYGQGMSVASFGALALADELQSLKGGSLDGFANRVQQRLAKAVAPAWLMATSEDARWPDTTGVEVDAPTRFMHWYTDQVFQLVPKDPEIYRAFLRIMHMLDASTALFRPRVLGAVLRNALTKGRAPAAAVKPAPEEATPATA